MSQNVLFFLFEIPGIFGGSEFRSGISFGYREDAGAQPVYKQNVRVTPPPPPLTQV